MMRKDIGEQECIPVGCVPSAASAVSQRWGVLPGGCVLPGGGAVPLRGCASRGGASWGVGASGGCVCFPRGCFLGGWCFWGGVCASRGVCFGGCASQGVCSLGGVLPGGVCFRGCVPRGQTDACKNITFATSLRTVKIDLSTKNDSARGFKTLKTTGRCLQMLRNKCAKNWESG